MVRYHTHFSNEEVLFSVSTLIINDDDSNGNTLPTNKLSEGSYEK